MDRTALERNLTLYGWHQRFQGALFWVATWFLFLLDRFGLEEALRVQAVYYFAVVVLEVPSGWASDRFGRALTLRLAAASWVVAHVVFVFAESPGLAAVAQVLLAAGFASISGTDVTLHYDTLEQLGRAAQFESSEADVRRQMLYAKAASAAIGGGLALIDLRLPFVAAAFVAGAQLIVALGFRPVPTQTTSTAPESSEPTKDRFRDEFRQPLLRWILLSALGQVVTIHLAAELGAPYLAEVLDGGLDDTTTAAFVNGALAAAVALIGAFSLGRLTRLTAALGATGALAVLLFVPPTLLALMAAVQAVWVIPFLALRGVQSAASTVLISGIVGATVAPNRRATSLSLSSLAGRLSYSAALVGLSGVSTFGATLWFAAIGGLVLAALVAFSRQLLPEQDRIRARVVDHDHPEMTHSHPHSHDEHHRHTSDTNKDAGDPHSHTHTHRALRHRHAVLPDLHH